MPSLVAVEAFVAVAEARSFLRASRNLGLSPAAVSRSVKRLEQELGTELIHRTTRRVELSREGQAFHRRARVALEELRLAADEVALARVEVRGTVTMSASLVLGRWLAGELPKLMDLHPDLHVELELSDSYRRLVDDRVDVALRVGHGDGEGLVAKKLRDVRWCTVASPAYLARFGLPQTPDDLTAHRCLVFRGPRGRVSSWNFQAPGSDRVEPLSVTGALSLDQGELLVDLALAGGGICQVFDFMVVDAIANGSLVRLLPHYEAPGPTLNALCLPGQRRNPRVRALFDFLASCFTR
ncbi:MAG: LysR family transcriptional regulator [Polyangiaceae bacterium]